MKIWFKIFLSTVIVFILISTILGVIIIENNYAQLVNRELESALTDQKKISNLLEENIVNYSLLKWRNNFFIKSESNKNLKTIIIEDIESLLPKVSSSNIYLELVDASSGVVTSTTPDDFQLNIIREEFKLAKKDYHSYVLRHINNGYYIFVVDKITLNFTDNYLVSYIKDISYVDEIRYGQYRMFVIADIVAIAVIAFLMLIISKIITKPISNLIKTTESITSGNYAQKVTISNNDEIGVLADRFNVMTGTIHDNINALKFESEKKQRFINNLTHELKTPLTSVIGYSETLVNKDYDEELYKFALNHINNEGKRMKDIIDRMLNIIVVGERNIKLESTSVDTLFAEVSSIMRLKLEKSNIHLKVIPSDKVIRIDASLIKQVLINLIDNAIKVSDPYGCIILGGEFNRHTTTLYVEDFGFGMEKDDLDKILEPFYRVDKSRNRMHGGAGLGLYICNEIVTLHNGNLKIESTVNQGTTIKIILPYM